MFKDPVEAAYPLADWSNVVCVGCDEMSVRKGRNCVSVFCDLLGKRMLFAAKGPDKNGRDTFLQAPEARNGYPRVMREISMDRRPSHIAGVQENIGSQAVMVFEKSHVTALVDDAVNGVRRA